MAVARWSDRQQQILEQAAQGRSDKEIALALGISVHTVRTHLQRLYRSEGFSNRAEAIAAWLGKAASRIAQIVPEEALGEQEERVSQAAALSAAAELAVQTLPSRVQCDLINQERSSSGLRPLEWDEQMAAVAELSARRMAEQGHLGTVLNAYDGDLNAENVGYWSGINDRQLHSLFVADPKQRANILGPHSRVGAAWAVTEAGVAFLSVVFA